MTTEKIKSASEVLDGFLEEQVEDESLDAGTVSAIRDLRAEGKFSKTQLLRRLEEARNKVLQDSAASEEDVGDG